MLGMADPTQTPFTLKAGGDPVAAAFTSLQSALPAVGPQHFVKAGVSSQNERKSLQGLASATPPASLQRCPRSYDVCQSLKTQSGQAKPFSPVYSIYCAIASLSAAFIVRWPAARPFLNLEKAALLALASFLLPSKQR